MPAAVPLYPDLKSASDWMKQISNQTEALCGPGLCMSTVWNFYARFSDVINFHGETTGGIVKSWLFSQAITPSLPLKLLNLFSQLLIQQAAKLINMVKANVEQS